MFIDRHPPHALTQSMVLSVISERLGGFPELQDWADCACAPYALGLRPPWVWDRLRGSSVKIGTILLIGTIREDLMDDTHKSRSEGETPTVAWVSSVDVKYT